MTRLFLTLLVFSLSTGLHAETPKGPAATPTYVVKLLQLNPPKLAVTAKLPMDGIALLMDQSRSAEVPEVADKGWPGLIRGLQVSDRDGRKLSVLSKGDAGWELAEAYHGTLTLNYQVDYSGPAANNWPAPRETAFADADHFIFVCRSVFITSAAASPADVEFELPAGWFSVAPWNPSGSITDKYSVASADDLVNNLVVLTRTNPEVVQAGEFQVFAVPMGQWEAVRSDLRRLLQGVIAYYVRMMGDHRPTRYLVVLLPIADSGGESFRSSFAFNVETPPTKATLVVWGHTIAHEVFHYWNGWRLRGSDYQSSQWFQEGFTEYAADRALLASGFMNEYQFRKRLAGYIDQYLKLTTPLSAPGGRKGPPLYSGGALVAFGWDVQIRNATRNRKGLNDFWRNLWTATNEGRIPYAWANIRTALLSVSPGDWEAFYQKYIVASGPLPLADLFSSAALQVDREQNGETKVKVNPAASPQASAVWRSLARMPEK